MKTAEQIVNEQLFMNHTVGFQKYETIEMMKEYARQCCQQLLKDAAENARQCIQYRYNDRMEAMGTDLIISKDSILNTEIKTP